MYGKTSLSLELLSSLESSSYFSKGFYQFAAKKTLILSKKHIKTLRKTYYINNLGLF